MSTNNELTSRIHAAYDLFGNLDDVESYRKKYNTEKYQVSLLKQFIDGVIATRTALMIDPYSDCKSTNGNTLLSLDKLWYKVADAHRRGLSTRLHACGDGAVRKALDAFEYAYNKYGDTGCRHAIEHNEIIHPDDIMRFAKLNIIASIQPEHMALTNDFDSNCYPDRCGNERCKYAWPIKTLRDSGAVVTLGSDTPVVSTNPFLALYRAVTRLHNDGNPKNGWNPHEKITIEEALDAHTYQPCFGVKREHELGTLEVGKIADMIVLDRNLLKIPADEILSTNVLMTIFDGEIIYTDGKSIHS